MTRNDITGDALRTDVPTDDYREGWERIFGNKPKPPAESERSPYEPHDEGNAPD